MRVRRGRLNEIDDVIEKVQAAKENPSRFNNLGMPDLQEYISLADANDDGVDFKEISAHIRKYMPVKEES